MFRIEMLPAQRGDSLWLSYGPSPDDLHHVLVDAGPQETIPTLVPLLEERIRGLPGDRDRVELLVVTHIDADHIQGVVSLLSDPARVPLFGDVWFNGFRHHVPDDFLGGPDAERLTLALLQHESRWNRAFDGHAVSAPDEGELPTRTLPGGLTLTVLGPTPTALARLAPDYEKACLKAGITPGRGAPIVTAGWVREGFLGGGFEPDELAASRTTSDSSKANGASITLVADYDGVRVLLLGDAPTRAVAAGLDRLGPGPHEFSAVKVSHHGSRNNTSLDLCRRIRSSRWLVSSNGAQFGHPDAECLGRIVVTQSTPTFFLNYVTDRVTDLIDGAGDRYRVALPARRGGDAHEEGIALDL